MATVRPGTVHGPRGSGALIGGPGVEHTHLPLTAPAHRCRSPSRSRSAGIRLTTGPAFTQRAEPPTHSTPAHSHARPPQTHSPLIAKPPSAPAATSRPSSVITQRLQLPASPDGESSSQGALASAIFVALTTSTDARGRGTSRGRSAWHFFCRHFFCRHFFCRAGLTTCRASTTSTAPRGSRRPPRSPRSARTATPPGRRRGRPGRHRIDALLVLHRRALYQSSVTTSRSRRRKSVGGSGMCSNPGNPPHANTWLKHSITEPPCDAPSIGASRRPSGTSIV